jgi:hypothetical protein
LKAKMRISATNGSAMARLYQVWEGKMPNNEMMKSTHR